MNSKELSEGRDINVEKVQKGTSYYPFLSRGRGTKQSKGGEKKKKKKKKKKTHPKKNHLTNPQTLFAYSNIFLPPLRILSLGYFLLP